jgi:predicted O-methyltransferase YrrM
LIRLPSPTRSRRLGRGRSLIKSRLRRLSPAWQDRLRRFSRLRWLEKARILRSYSVSVRDKPFLVVRYVLWDPDVGDFSYQLDNEGELAESLAGFLRLPRDTVAGYLAEAAQEPALTRELSERVRWRPDVKRRVGLGHRVAWYALVRALKPRLVVETGIKHGIGSLVLLVALERNAREGSPGRLVSFDIDPFSGWVVPERLRGNWEPVFSSTFDAFDATLDGESIDLFICDTPPDLEIESFETSAALRHAAPGMVLVAGNGESTPVLAELAAERRGRYQFFCERPRRHIYPGGGLGLATDLSP